MELKAIIVMLALFGAAGLVYASAPDDQQNQCTKRTLPTDPGHGLVGAYTSTQRPLMDSYWYTRLVGSTGVWDFIQGNDGRNGWRRGQIALCRNTIVSRFSRNNAEDNWFATQFISKSFAQNPTYPLPIIVNVTYSFLSCTPKRFRLHYYPSASTPESSSGTNNYIHIGEVNTNEKSLQMSTFKFNLASQYSGFYLGFQDQDSCGIIQRMQAYCTICPSRTEGLVMYPLTPASTSAVSVTHQCRANAEVSGGGLMCHPDGSWSGSPRCNCISGHILVGGNCLACAAGTFQSGNSCVNCPANTIGTGVGVAVCPCQANYYRAPSDSPSDPCTVPPTKVLNLRVTHRSNTTITIEWDSPATTGRADIFYRISYRRVGSEDLIKRNTTQTSYQLTGLQPLSTYKITVVSSNGITEELEDIAAITLSKRTVLIINSTTEGVPGPPASVAVVCQVVIWEPPQSPNGILTGYTIRVYRAGNIRQAQIINVGVKPLYYQITSSDIPDGVGRILVQVRGRTKVGPGEWSTPPQQLEQLSDGPNSEPTTVTVTTTRTLPPVTVTPPPVTVTATRTLPPVTVTQTPPPVTVTRTLPPVTVTRTLSPAPAPVPSCSVTGVPTLITSTITATQTETIIEPRTVVVTETPSCPSRPIPIVIPCPLPPVTNPACPEPIRSIREEITTAVGNITTPSHPLQAYPRNADYFWTIKLPNRNRAVVLTFHGTFDIENTRNCSGSYLEIRDGDSSDSVLVGRYCGTRVPSPVSSSTNSLYIHFHSSSRQANNTGFNATFKSIKTIKSEDCSALVTKSAFSSTGFPSPFTRTTPHTCNYLIANFRSFADTDVRFLYTDLKNCTQGMIEVLTHRETIATICNAEDAQKVIHVKDFLFDIRYTVKVPGLRGFALVLSDKCANGKELSRNGTCV